MMDLVDRLDYQLDIEESVEKYLYDDATGKRFVKGMTLVGNLTIATGVNLMIGMDAEEINWISKHRMQKVLDSLQPFAWFAMQDQVRQVACADIAFNIGLVGLLHWPSFLSHLGKREYSSAVAEIKGNQLWVSQVKEKRAGRIEGMIATGIWPKDIDYGGSVQPLGDAAGIVEG